MNEHLTAEDICRIMKTSAELGVLDFKYGSLHFKRSGGQGATELDIAPLSDDTHKAQTESAIVADEIKLKQDQLENMIIENPLEAERLMQDLEEDDGTEYEQD